MANFLSIKGNLRLCSVPDSKVAWFSSAFTANDYSLVCPFLDYHLKSSTHRHKERIVKKGADKDRAGMTKM